MKVKVGIKVNVKADLVRDAWLQVVVLLPGGEHRHAQQADVGEPHHPL